MLRSLKLQSQSYTKQLAKTYSTVSKDYALTTLDNGVKVATSNVPGHFSALGLYVNAGSRYENNLNKGCTHIVDRLSFKSTTHLSGLEMQSKLELLGGNYQCSSSRETMMYQASVFNKDLNKMFDLLVDTVRNPALTDEEIFEQKQIADYEISEVWNKTDLILPELLHQVAYSNETLGSPLLCPREQIPNINKYMISDYRNKFYNPENITAAFVGVKHEEAVKLTTQYFNDMTSKAPYEKKLKNSHYTGGEMCIPSSPVYGGLPELCHMQIAFEGLPIDHPDIYTLATLQTLLGGGGSFSAGGPGKGMYSRLYTKVLNIYGFVENCVAFNHAYSDSGLFGISLSCVPQAAHVMGELLAQQLSNTFTTGAEKLTDEEINRAKTQLKSSLLMNLESKIVELEDLGRQVSLNGKKVPVQEMIEKINNVTAEDIRRVAETVFTGKVENAGKGSGKATVVMQGAREKFGDIEQILKVYGLGNYPDQDNSNVKKLKKRRGW